MKSGIGFQPVIVQSVHRPEAYATLRTQNFAMQEIEIES